MLLSDSPDVLAQSGNVRDEDGGFGGLLFFCSLSGLEGTSDEGGWVAILLQGLLQMLSLLLGLLSLGQALGSLKKVSHHSSLHMPWMVGVILQVSISVSWLPVY